LPHADVPDERLRDPEAIAFWPSGIGRDGARTPMPWSSTAPNLGFSTATPWLPAGEGHRLLAVDAQQEDRDSLLAFTRDCLRLRRADRALREGSMRILEAGEQILSFERAAGGERLRCTFNLSNSSAPFAAAGEPLIGTGAIDAGELGPYAARVEVIE
jgi:alpha-glucosidase